MTRLSKKEASKIDASKSDVEKLFTLPGDEPGEWKIRALQNFSGQAFGRSTEIFLFDLLGEGTFSAKLKEPWEFKGGRPPRWYFSVLSRQALNV